MGRPRRTVLVTSRWVASAAVMAAMATGTAAAAAEEGPSGSRGPTSPGSAAASVAGHASEPLGEGSGRGAEPGRVEELHRGVDLRKA
ncbi:hypothetical protein GCM10027215_09120 [Nocardioides zeae]